MKSMVALKPMRYGTRHLVAGERFDCKPRDATLLTKLKRAKEFEREKAEIPPLPETLKSAVAPQSVPQTDERAALRAEYEAKFGKRPYMGWSADELQKRLDDAE